MCVEEKVFEYKCKVFPCFQEEGGDRDDHSYCVKSSFLVYKIWYKDIDRLFQKFIELRRLREMRRLVKV